MINTKKSNKCMTKETFVVCDLLPAKESNKAKMKENI